MIAHLKGTVLVKTERYLVVRVHDIGYRVFVLPQTAVAAELGDEIELHTYHHQTENASELYGFATLEDMDFFERLLGISGVGPKSALGVLSTAPVRDIQQAIIQNDPTLLTRVSGIGRKTAERIIVELREKLEKSGLVGDTMDQTFIDALEALVQLGYSRPEARQALRQIKDQALNAQDRLKQALKILGKR
jgi:Holliday junction DNA helicase RuvA